MHPAVLRACIEWGVVGRRVRHRQIRCSRNALVRTLAVTGDRAQHSAACLRRISARGVEELRILPC